jgi:hypothetical protein
MGIVGQSLSGKASTNNRMRHRGKHWPAAVAGWPRTILSCLFALAIILQGAVLQSHIHGALSVSNREQADVSNMDISATEKAALKANGNPSTPAKGDPVNCFLCQQLKLAGATVLPASPVLVTVEQYASVEHVSPDTSSITSAVSHAWQSRAPPLSI